MIQRSVYVTKKTRIEPICVVYNGNVPISLKVEDYTLDNTATAKVYSEFVDTGDVYQNSGTITPANNYITFVPDAGLFRPGRNKLQVKITVTPRTILSFQIDVLCEGDLSAGEVDDPIAVQSAAQRAESAATRAEAVQASIPSSYTQLSNDVDGLKQDLVNLSNNDMTKSIVSAGSTTYDYYFVKGFEYVLSNTSNNSNIIARTKDTSGNTIDTITSGLLPNNSVSFIPTQNASKLFVYANGSATFTIKCNDTFDYIKSMFDFTIKSERQLSSPDSIVAHPECANLDTLKINSIYTYTKSSVSAITSSYPFPKGFTIATLNSLINNYAGCVQIAIDLSNGNIACRVNAGSWSPWNYQNNLYFEVGTGGDFTTLKSCTEFIANNSIKNAKVYVKAQTFDLVSEYGQSYLDSLVQTENKGIGLHVGNNTHYIFAEGSKVVFNYVGNNTACGQYFSPFNVTGSVILENANIECSNCRYCVHEDLPTSAEVVPGSTIVKYINCVMKNSYGTVGYEAPSCIGAGTNKNTLSVIEGGSYDSAWNYDICYHNYNGNLPSRVVCKDVWMKNGFRCGEFSYSTVDVEISGCRMSKDIFNKTSQYFNVKEWNNIIQAN